MQRNKMYGWTFKLFVAIYSVAEVISETRGPCLASTSTTERVNSCPTTEMSWAERERNKDCQSVQQNCTIPEKFRYHCVVNEWRNATLELCAPVRNIVDQCAEYNIGAHQIQYNRQNCTKFSTPCPHLYKSNKVYKYPDCFKLKSPPHNSTIDDHRNRVNVLNISWLDDSEKHISGITQIYSSRLTFLIAFVTAYYQSTF